MLLLPSSQNYISRHSPKHEMQHGIGVSNILQQHFLAAIWFSQRGTECIHHDIRLVVLNHVVVYAMDEQHVRHVIVQLDLRVPTVLSTIQ